MTVSPPLKPAEALVGEKAKSAYAIWKQVRGDRLAPRRKEITLNLVANLTPWMWMADVIDGGADFRLGLNGDRLIQFFGRSYSGSLLSGLSSRPFFQRVKLSMAFCNEHKQPVAISSSPSSYEGKNHWETEALVLPLSEDGENVTSLMGVFEYWPLGTMTGIH